MNAEETHSSPDASALIESSNSSWSGPRHLRVLKWVKVLGPLIVVPMVLAWVVNLWSDHQKEREIEARFVELAVRILEAEPRPETKALREWAILVLDRYSRVRFSEEARRTLSERQSLPPLFDPSEECRILRNRAEQLDRVGQRVAADAYELAAQSLCRDAKFDRPGAR